MKDDGILGMLHFGSKTFLHHGSLRSKRGLP